MSNGAASDRAWSLRHLPWGRERSRMAVTLSARVSNARAPMRHRHSPKACSFRRGDPRPSKGCRDDRSYFGIPPQPPRGWAVPGARPRCRARQLCVLCQGFARHSRVLRREGQSRSKRPRIAGGSWLLFRHRLGCRDRTSAGGGRGRGPHQLRQYDQEGARHQARL